MRVCLAVGDGLFRKGGCVIKKCVKPDVITVHAFRLPTLRERVEEHTRDGMDTLYLRPFRGASSHLSGSQMGENGTGGRGEHSTSRAVHRRVVLPAARASVRCR
jgi:hypothetical protein